MELRLTRRALDDLGLDTALYARRPAADYVDVHEAVRAFVERRRQSPVGQETTQLPVSRQVVFNLHPGRWRGDAYAVLKRRDESGDLFPTEQDYLDLEPDIDEALAFVEAVANEGPALLERARANPGEPVSAVVGDTLDVGVLVDVIVIDDSSAEEIWIGVSLPPRKGARLPGGDWISVVLAGVLGPSASMTDIDFPPDFPGDEGARYAVVARWCTL